MQTGLMLKHHNLQFETNGRKITKIVVYNEEVTQVISVANMDDIPGPDGDDHYPGDGPDGAGYDGASANRTSANRALCVIILGPCTNVRNSRRRDG